jgi:hypothetical protein
MTAVPVEQVQQRTGEQEDQRQIRVHVRAMLGNEEEACDEQEAPENPAAVTAAAGWVMVVRVFSHGELDAIAGCRR